jgi:hypothetical protein
MMVQYLRALVVGVIALVVNFSLLGLADRLGIVTARGGFQRLVKLWTGPALDTSGVAKLWSDLHLPEPSSALFQNAFKVAVGLGFALIYVAIKRYLPGTAIVKGLTYALIVWLINAAVVLPALGQGFAGANTLTATGIIAFAIAHTSFFIVLAVLEEWPIIPTRSASATQA